MKCPHCSKDIRDDLIISGAAKINGKRAGRSDGGGARCPNHGVFMKNGKCKRCEAKEGAVDATKERRRSNGQLDPEKAY